jgi:predicted transcriptional regulator
MALNGPLHEFPLNDIISLVELGKQTGAAEIRSDMNGRPVIGRIYFRAGQVIHAELENLPAEESILTMFTLTEGSFQFLAGETPPKEDIKRNNAFLIMMGINRSDEYKKIKEIVPSTDLVPMLVDNIGMPQVNLTQDEWKVLTATNGKDNLENIARITRLGDFRTRKAVAHLLEMGLIEKKQRNIKYILYAELDNIATSHLGNAAKNLLDQAYQRVKVRVEDDVTYEQALEIVKMFGKLAGMLMGPSRAKVVTDQMTERVRAVFEQ